MNENEKLNKTISIRVNENDYNLIMNMKLNKRDCLKVCAINQDTIKNLINQMKINEYEKEITELKK